jgi:hypothetical protein
MVRLTRIALALVLGCTCALGAEPPGGAVPGGAVPGGAVKEYEGRLEELSKEVQDIRRELEQLVQEVVEGEMGRLILFLEGPAPAFKDKGVELSVDGKPVASRPLSPAEIDVLTRGLPLELAELRVAAGDHQVSLGPLAGEPAPPVQVKAERGKVTSWIAKVGTAGMEWRPAE